MRRPVTMSSALTRLATGNSVMSVQRKSRVLKTVPVEGACVKLRLGRPVRSAEKESERSSMCARSSERHPADAEWRANRRATQPRKLSNASNVKTTTAGAYTARAGVRRDIRQAIASPTTDATAAPASITPATI